MRLLHINDNTLMVNGLNTILKDEFEIEVVSTITKALQRIEAAQFDAIICNVTAFSSSYISELLRHKTSPRVLLFSDLCDSNEVQTLIKIGVAGYISFVCDEEEVKKAVNKIIRGEKFYCSKVLDIIMSQTSVSKEPPTTTLSDRENQVTTLIANGYTNKQIGSKLFLSHHTIHTHRKNILRKLGINNTPELTMYAIQSGLI